MMHAMATCWVDRFSALRQYKETPEDDENIVVGETIYSRKLLIERIERDSYEHYLLIQQFVTQASVLWTPLLLTIDITSVIFITYCLYTIIFVDYIFFFYN